MVIDKEKEELYKNIQNILAEEFVDTTIDDATKRGLKELYLSKDEVNIKILSEGTPGLFGLRGEKPARIVIYPKQEISCIIKFFLTKICKFFNIKDLSIETKLDDNVLKLHMYIKDENFINLIKKKNFELYNAVFVILETFLHRIDKNLYLVLEIDKLYNHIVNKVNSLFSIAKVKKEVVLTNPTELLLNAINLSLHTRQEFELIHTPGRKKHTFILKYKL